MKSTQIAQWGSSHRKHSANKPQIAAHTFGYYSNIGCEMKADIRMYLQPNPKNHIQLGLFFVLYLFKTLHWSCRLDDVAQSLVHSTTHIFWFLNFEFDFDFDFISYPVRNRLIDFYTRCATGFFCCVCEPPTGFSKNICHESAENRSWFMLADDRFAMALFDEHNFHYHSKLDKVLTLIALRYNFNRPILFS